MKNHYPRDEGEEEAALNKQKGGSEERKEKEEKSAMIVGYREDIDGLRGVAVSSVILFHFWKSILPGGFCGVDVFFVISGFLITSNILKEMKAGKFSFSNFYSRRVKRIFPASAMCIFVVLVYSWLAFLPNKFVETANSAIWSVLSSSNFYNTFCIKTGYFGDDTSTIPLMHLWSLAVEEQFYMIWPVLILLLVNMDSRNSSFIIFFLVLLSTVAGELVYRGNASLAYYMLPMRMGEMMVGSLLAFHKPKLTTNQREMGGLLGLTLIGASLFLIKEDQVFPGFRSLVPCLGTYLVILSGCSENESISSKILSFKPLVQVGLVSYSAYLYHWPVAAFSKYRSISFKGMSAIDILLVLLSLTLMSYFLVEKPLRVLQWKPKKTFVVLFLVPAIIIVGVSVAAINYAQNESEREMKEVISKQANFQKTETARPQEKADPEKSPAKLKKVERKKETKKEAPKKPLFERRKFERKDTSKVVPAKKEEKKVSVKKEEDEAIPSNFDTSKLKRGVYGFHSSCSSNTPKVCYPQPTPNCRAHDLLRDFNKERCWNGDLKSPHKPFLVIGDSHAAHFFPFIERFALEMNLKFFLWAHAATLPDFLSTERRFGVGREEWQVKTCSADGFRFNLPLKGKVSEFSVIVIARRYFYEGSNTILEENVSWLVSNNKSVVLMGQIPAIANEPKDCPLVKSRNPLIAEKCNVKRSLKQQTDLLKNNQVMKEMARKFPSVSYWEINERICPQDECSIYYRNLRMYSDTNHISFLGAEQMASDIVEKEGVPKAFSSQFQKLKLE